MDIKFKKMHGLGNDFVMIDNMDNSIALSPEQVACICDRHFGVGADGVILVEPSKNDDGFMNYINSDGTFAQMCGNGVRCFAKFLVDYGYVDAATGNLAVETRAGTRKIVFDCNESGKLVNATVDMGKPILTPSLVPVDADPNSESFDGTQFVKEMPISSPWGAFEFTMVSMGNPHAVCFIDDINSISDELFYDPCDKRLDTLNLDLVGAFYESNAVFPEKTNVEFAIAGVDSISMRVYERGCGETLACGTGACATSVAAALTGRSSMKNSIKLKGGVLEIDWKDDGHIYMTGPAEESFSGVISVG